VKFHLGHKAQIKLHKNGNCNCKFMNYTLNLVIMTKFCNLGIHSTGDECVYFAILSHLYLLENLSQ